MSVYIIWSLIRSTPPNFFSIYLFISIKNGNLLINLLHWLPRRNARHRFYTVNKFPKFINVRESYKTQESVVSNQKVISQEPIITGHMSDRWAVTLVEVKSFETGLELDAHETRHAHMSDHYTVSSFYAPHPLPSASWRKTIQKERMKTWK